MLLYMRAKPGEGIVRRQIFKVKSWALVCSSSLFKALFGQKFHVS